MSIMAKTKVAETAKKGKKRGPKEKRLVITEDPTTALARLFKPVKK